MGEQQNQKQLVWRGQVPVAARGQVQHIEAKSGSSGCGSLRQRVETVPMSLCVRVRLAVHSETVQEPALVNWGSARV